MRHPRILAMAAAALVGAGVLVAPPASAATAVTIDCATQTSTSFTVSPGEEIVFTLNSACRAILENASIDDGNFAAFVLSIVQNNTGATITSAWGAAPTVAYTAGSTPGTDTLILSTDVVIPSMRERLYRNGALTNSYFMTVPGGGAGPVPWLQEMGRQPGETCQAGWNPSWGQWMNSGAGGFTCVREYYYNSATGAWAYRKG